MWVKQGGTIDIHRGGATHSAVILEPLQKLLKMDPFECAFTFDLQVQVNSAMLKATQVGAITAAVCLFAQTHNHTCSVKKQKKGLQCLSNHHHHYHHHAWWSEQCSEKTEEWKNKEAIEPR